MRPSNQARVWPLWFILALATPLVLLVRGTNRGEYSLSSVQEFVVACGILLLLSTNLVLGAMAIDTGRRAAWWPTLVSVAALAAFGYAAFSRSRGQMWMPF